MVEVTVTHHHCLDIGGVEVQTPHVLDHPLRADPGVEEHRVRAPTPFELDQRREPVLGLHHVGPRALKHREVGLGPSQERRTHDTLV